MIARLKYHIESLLFRVFGPWALGFVHGLLRGTIPMRDRSKPTILAITQPLFEKDIAEISRHERFNWLLLPAPSRVQKRFLPKELCTQRFYYPSLTDPKHRDAWHAAEQFGRGVMSALRLRAPIAGVLTAHVDYWQDEGIRRACARLGIPFIVLCHENYNIPKTYRVRRDEFADLDFKFGGTAIATFSDHMRELFVAAGVHNSERIVVTGPPRLDGWQRIENRPGRRIVFLSFLNPGKYYASDDYFFSVLDALKRVAVTAPEGWELVVKCKNFRDCGRVRQHLGDTPRVSVGFETPLPELLSTASVIVGANSFSMIEALLSGAQLLVPKTAGDAIDPETVMFDPADALVARCIDFADSLADLEARLRAAMTRPAPAIDRAARMSLLTRYVYYTELEPSGLRVTDFIENVLNTAASAAVKRPASYRQPVSSATVD